MDENNKTSVIFEDETEQEDALKNFDKAAEKPEKKKKTSTATKTLIIAVSAAVVLAAVLLTLLFLPQDNEVELTDTTASITSKLDKNNVWQVTVKTKDGKIENNGSGELLSLIPSDIKKIKLENDKGTTVITSYTPKTKTKETDPETGEQVEQTEQTVYTVKGYEDFDLQSGEPDEIASVCSNLEFSSVSCVDIDGKLADFGFDEPRSVAYVTYDDGTKSVIKVGDNAPQNMGTYVMFGSGKSVFLCSTESVEHLLYGITDLMSLTINEAATDTETSEFKSITLSGKNFSDTVVLEPNQNAEVDSDYVITSPSEVFADNTEASEISGGIRGLYADKVRAVNPSSAQLKKLGLSNPYAEIKAVYSDDVIKLIATKPDSDGNCLLMEKGGSLVYSISADKIAWVKSSYTKLLSEYVLSVDLKSLDALTVDGYKFDVTTKTVNTTDEEGEESSTTETTAKYNGKKLDEGYFETLFNNISLLKKSDKTANSPSGEAQLKVVYSYSSDRGDDTVEFYKGGSKHIAVLNGTPVGTVNSSYVTKLKEQAKDMSKNKKVKTFW